jgi:hypothetical protein
VIQTTLLVETVAIIGGRYDLQPNMSSAHGQAEKTNGENRIASLRSHSSVA